MTTIAIDAGLKGPIAVRAGSSAPSSTSPTTNTTAIPSTTGTSDPTRKVSGRTPDAAASHTTSTIVWIAIPPIRLPAARPRWPCAVAVTVMTISGRLPAIASRIIPPSAVPRPSRLSSSSVVLERATPAIHVAAEAARNTTTRSGVERPAIAAGHYSTHLDVRSRACRSSPIGWPPPGS